MKEIDYVMLGAVGVAVYTLIKYPLIGVSALAAYAIFVKPRTNNTLATPNDMSVVDESPGRSASNQIKKQVEKINFKFYDSYNKSEFNLEEQVR